MKNLIPGLFFVALVAGCSPKRDSANPTTSPAGVSSDLGKGTEYFRNLYGAPKVEKKVANFDFILPAHVGAIRLTRPLVVQQFQSDKLAATVLYSETPHRAIWVKYTLPFPWTQEQVNAALTAYGSEWKIVQQNLGESLILRDRAAVAYRSSAGVLASKTILNELIVYAPQLQVDLKGQIEEAKRQKRTVPKF